MKRLLLYLMTTSPTKAAHLRTLFQMNGVDVLRWHAFRGYPELQVERASDSLKLGAEHIRSRFSRPFIIEDTEVRIEAYSKGSGISYPGFDLKRWWKVTTFREIDARCHEAGTRAASHISNLCLSIPGLEPYFYRGTVKGEIANRPYDGPDRPEAPWLSATQFASIFVPHGAKQPYAALSLEDSWRFDFRKRAVDQAISKIAEVNAILNIDAFCYITDDDEAYQPSTDQLALFDDECDGAPDSSESP